LILGGVGSQPPTLSIARIVNGSTETILLIVNTLAANVSSASKNATKRATTGSNRGKT